MLAGDDEEAARQREKKPTDPRVTHLWDADRRVSRLFGPLLNLSGPAWDLYLLYDTGTRWDGDKPPMPAFWMHQLSAGDGADPSLCLDPVRLAARLQELLPGSE